MIESMFRHRRDLEAEIQRLRAQVDQLAGTLAAHDQRYARIRTYLEARIARVHLRRLLDTIHQVAELQVKASIPAAEAIAAGLRSAMQPLPIGVAGGRARAQCAYRYDDGTFASYEDLEAYWRERSHRGRHGGLARARTAKRAPDGTFV